PPTVCDGNGAFGFDVVPPGSYRMRAQFGQSWSELVEVESGEGAAEKVVQLQFAGAFSLTGRLLDVEGKPIAGARVVLVNSAAETVRFAKTGADGLFEALLTGGGGFDVLGGIAGQTLAHDVVELTDARPHQQVTLRTTPFAVVAGRVVDER